MSKPVGSRFARLFRHWWARMISDHGGLREDHLSRIEAAIGSGEALHDAEVRFVVEAGLSAADVWHEVTPRARSIVVFAQLGVWDTENNNGVMLYVCSADHAIEVVADRGVVKLVDQAQWDGICRSLVKVYQQAKAPEERCAGIQIAVQEIHALLARHYPPKANNRDELPNRPVLL